MAEHLGKFHKQEGVVFVGKAQEKTPVFRTEKRRSPVTGMARNPRYAKSPGKGKGIRSREKALAQLRERSLPEDLIDHLRKAPEMWDPDPTA
jgi:hypothetical protein